MRSRKPAWYSLPENESPEARIFLTNALGDRHLHKYSDTAVIADKRLHVVLPKKGVSWKLLIAVLNSSFVAVSAELAGRIVKGDGVLEVDYDDLHDHLRVPDVRQFSKEDSERILDAFSKLVDRPIGTIEREIAESDRMDLDQAVLGAIGLSHRKFLKPLYEGLCELAGERTALGRMRSKARKTKARGVRAEKKVAEEVLDEILPDGPKRFPDDFLSGAASTATKTPVALPEEPLILDNSPLFSEVHTADNSFTRPVKTRAEGKFLVYAHGCGHRTVELPEKVVEVSRTVANYEQYLRDLRKQFYETYFRRTLDTRTAARLTQAAFERFRLPTVEG